MATPEILTIASLSCRYPQLSVLENVSFSVHEGEMVCLLGASGDGKTTLLKSIAGLLPQEQGRIAIAGQKVDSQAPGAESPPRVVGMVFQDDVLFPHLTVMENITFGLRGKSSEEVSTLAMDAVGLMQLETFTRCYPHELSSEQSQRAALARALACQPKLLLLDEPFSSVDSQIRYRLISELRQILRQRQIATLFATSDREDAFAFADHLILIHDGGIVQQGFSADLYYRPVSRYVASFMGNTNYLPVKISGDRQWQSFLGEHQATRALKLPHGARYDWLVRPQEIALALDEEGSGVIEDRLFMGTSNFYRVRVNMLALQVQSGNWFEPGQPVRLSIRTDQPVLFPPEAAVGSPE
ncbi:ABC transporter ATP-binding protein [Dickeya dianthicola]|uniref:ABC transporter ATP-binding protein n=1 Tax=Dickeya dianthicola TaxID=204039 RepID=UPI0013714C3B|nr:ABC transporter ATP-binding protein [Dickeya dianthicola]MCI4239040.1 ABC transporter ATP-binding protein [Dickeya dianthicola]MCI4257210.1 ABC transporter ATP-binding protein [Dickeya dianthicola]MZG24048.1 ABC transporter ATP-binding protein [Dickeya dianthicola]MZI90419.1 ABC transporter ATP-binding protein [Dickeya dianthicola]